MIPHTSTCISTTVKYGVHTHIHVHVYTNRLAHVHVQCHAHVHAHAVVQIVLLVLIVPVLCTLAPYGVDIHVYMYKSENKSAFCCRGIHLHVCVCVGGVEVGGSEVGMRRRNLRSAQGNGSIKCLGCFLNHFLQENKSSIIQFLSLRIIASSPVTFQCCFSKCNAEMKLGMRLVRINTSKLLYYYTTYTHTCT